MGKTRVLLHFLPLSITFSGQIAYAYQVIGRGGKGENSIHTLLASMVQFVQAADGFHPGKNLFYAFANP